MQAGVREYKSNKTIGDSIEYKDLAKEHIKTPDSFSAKDPTMPRRFATFSLKTILVFDYLMHFFTCYPKNNFPSEELGSLYGPEGETCYTEDGDLLLELTEKLKDPKSRYKLVKPSPSKR